MLHQLTRRVLARLTYANVVATLALVIAVGGGTAYAATQLSKNSVGSKQLRTGAVRASEVKNGSLGTGDLSKKARARLAGKAGPQGPAGPAGAAGGSSEFAIVSPGGSTRGGTAVTAPGPDGAYTLQFNRDVSGCAYNATLAAVDSGGGQEAPPAGGTAAVNSGGGALVTVRVYSAGGSPARSGFHLTVTCPR